MKISNNDEHYKNSEEILPNSFNDSISMFSVDSFIHDYQNQDNFDSRTNVHYSK